MNLLGFNIHISRSSRSAAPPLSRSTPSSPDALAWLRGGDLDVAGPSLSNAYQQVVWVYRAINAVAEQVANIPFLFSAGERGRENLITSGPLVDFYNRPHPHLNRFQYWELRVIWLMLRGECFRIPIYQEPAGGLSLSSAWPPAKAGEGRGEEVHSALRTPHSTLKAVLILDPSRFQHIVEDHRLIGWRYTGFGPQAPLESQIFLPEEVWFERLPNPFDFWRGLSPLSVAAMAAQTDFAAGAFMRGLIENNADAGLIVRSDKPVSDEMQDQFIAALKNRKRRAGFADKPLFLNGVTEIVKPTLSSTDLQFLENRKFSRAEICAAFGVPEEIVATSDYNKYDVMQGARLNFIENRIAPLCSRLEAEENATTIPALLSSSSSSSSIENQNSKIENPTGWFDLDSLPIMQEARRNRLAAARTGFDMGVPFNELNRVLDLGFKPLPWGDRGYIAARLQEVGGAQGSEIRGQSSELREQSTIRGPESACAPLFRNPQSALRIPKGGEGERGVRACTERSAASPDPLVRAAGLLAEVSQPQAAPRDAALVKKLTRFFFEQRGRVLANLVGAPGQTSQTSLTSPTSPTPPLLFDLASENSHLAALVRPLLAPAEHPQQCASALEQLNQTTLALLEEALGEGRAAGESPDQLAARVKAFYNDTSLPRARELAAMLAVAGLAGIKI
jgi:phage portal protein BeeE